VSEQRYDWGKFLGQSAGAQQEAPVQQPDMAYPAAEQAEADPRSELAPLFIDALKPVTVTNYNVMMGYFESNPDALRASFLGEGRNEKTETLVRKLHPNFSEQQVKDYFNPSMLIVEQREAEGGKGVLGTFTAGVGDLVSALVSAPLKWMGHEEAGEKVGTFARYMQAPAAPVPFEPGEFSWSELKNPQFYSTYGVRMLPILMGFVAGAILAFGLATYATGAAAVGIATKVGLGAKGTFVVKQVLASLVAAGMMRPIESTMEGGMAYEEAREKGFSHEEADKVANEVFNKNMRLVGLDAVQIGVAFAPTGGLGTAVNSAARRGLIRVARVGGKLIIEGLTEGGEEVYQEAMVKQALGEPVDWTSPEMQLVFSLGAIAGVGFGAGGDIMANVANRGVSGLTPQQKALFDQSKSEFVKQGMEEGQAAIEALGEVIEKYPEVATMLAAITPQVMNEYMAQFPEAMEAAQKNLETMGMQQSETVTGEPTTMGEATTTAMADWGDISGIEEWLSNDPVATYTVHVGNRRVHLDYFLKQGSWPESFTVKEAAALMQKPVEFVQSKIEKAGIATDRVESAYVLDEISEQFNMSEQEFINRLRQIHEAKQQIKRLEIEGEAPTAEPAVPTKPVVGEQAGMMGVSQKVHTQKTTGKPVTADMDAYAKLQEITGKAVEPTAVAAEVTAPAAPETAETPYIPQEMPTTPPPITPEGEILGRSDNGWDGFMKDLQPASTVADIAFRNDAIRSWVKNTPALKAFYKLLNPSVVANTPAEQAIIIRATLQDEGQQKAQGVIAHINKLGSQEKVFGEIDSKGFIKSGPLKGQTLGDIAQHRAKWDGKLTDKQKFWLDSANVIEDACIKLLKQNDIDVNLLTLTEGGQFATRRVWAKTLGDGSVTDIAYVGTGARRPGAKLPTEKHRVFKTEAEAIDAGYRYVPYEEALYLKVAGTYNRVADKKMADWLLSKVQWRTTGAPEELKIAAMSAQVKLRHSQTLLAGLNRAVRGERLPDATIQAIARSYPEQAKALKDLIPRIQANQPTADDVQSLTRVANGLINTNQMESYRAIAARARAREAAMTTRYGEARVDAPAFAGKILTGPEAKETSRVLRESFEPSFSKALGEVNKANAVARYFVLAGDFSPFAIQLIFLIGENPKIYGQSFHGALQALVNPDFHSGFLANHKATIDKHPNLLVTKSGATEFTEAMSRGGWLSGQTSFRPDGESYLKSLGLAVPRAIGQVGATALTPFQRVFEASLDVAGIYMAEAYEHLCTTPEATAEVDQFINEFRGMTSSARIGVPVHQRQVETAGILAPRYNRAIAGLLIDLARGGIRGHLARKSMAKGVAALCALAFAISLARGEDKDEILDHYNPRSSNFFTWDIGGQKVGPGSKVRSVAKLIAQSTADPDRLLKFSMENPALRFVRGNLSPVASTGLDLITGRNYIGDPTRDGLLSFSKEIIASNLLPIWVQTTLLEGGDLQGRAIRGGVEFLGGRAYPEPLWNEVARLRDRYAQQDFGADYKELNRAQIDVLKSNHPDLVELEEKSKLESAERGSELDKWMSNAREQAVSQRNDGLENAAQSLLSGVISKYDYDKERGYIRPYYSGAMSVLYSAREALDPDSVKDINKWLDENQKPEDKALDAYQEYRATLIEQAELPKDWDAIEQKSNTFLSQYPRPIQEYVKANLNRWINDLPENAKQVELMRLQGIEDETWWDDYRGAKETSQYDWGKVSGEKKTTSTEPGYDWGKFGG